MKNSIARAPCWTTQLRFSKSEFKSGIFLKSEFKGGMFLNCSYNPHVLIGSVKIIEPTTWSYKYSVCKSGYQQQVRENIASNWPKYKFIMQTPVKAHPGHSYTSPKFCHSCSNGRLPSQAGNKMAYSHLDTTHPNTASNRCFWGEGKKTVPSNPQCIYTHG